MNTQKSDFKTIYDAQLEGKEKTGDLTDAIMNRIAIVAEQKKARFRKEKIIMRIYLIAMAAVSTSLWLASKNPDVSISFNLDTFAMSNAAVLQYTRIAILIFVLSVLSFWIHAIKSKLSFV